jgi:hypothetical protein
MSQITQERIKELFDYQDGQLIRKVGRGKNGSSSRWKAGTSLGHTVDAGYVLASVDYKMYKLHRLIWLWHFGVFPKNHIDHIDGNPSNNRIENLREATDAQNMQNQRKPRRNNKLGWQGVYQVNDRFRAVLTTDGKAKHLGYFKTPEEAHASYIAAKRKKHEFSTI